MHLSIAMPIKFSLWSENPYTLNPYKLTGVSLEIGTVSQDDFFLFLI